MAEHPVLSRLERRSAQLSMRPRVAICTNPYRPPYAVRCIQQAITQALDDRTRLIRLPAQVGELLRQIAKLRDAWRARHGVEPTEEELSAGLQIPVAKLRAYLRAAELPASLDGAPPDCGDADLSAFVADARAIDPEAELFKGDRSRALYDLMKRVLTKQERRMLSQRFGLEKEDATEEGGCASGISRERTRQTELRALWKLRRAARECPALVSLMGETGLSDTSGAA